MGLTRTATATLPDAGSNVARTATATLPDAGSSVTRTVTAVLPDIDRVADIIGTLSATTGAATLSSASALQIAAALSATTGAATLSSVSALQIAAALSATTGAATLSSVSALQIAAALSATTGAATLSSASALQIAAALSATTGAATLSATGELSGDTTAPTVTAFVVTDICTTLAIPITTFTATDDVAVTGYLINESATTPSASDPGWVGTAPTTYTVGSGGNKTLYAWAKDAADNISTSSSAAVNVLIPVGVPATEADALIWLYKNTDGTNWTNNGGWLSDTIINNWYGVTVSGGHVTRLQLQNNGSTVSGSVANFAVDDLTNLTLLWLHNTSISGDISGWAVPSTVTNLQLYNTSVSGDISGWSSTPSFRTLWISDTSVSGDISGWTVPSNAYDWYLQSTSLSGAPIMTSAVDLRRFYLENCGLSQTDVDANITNIYNRRASLTATGHLIKIGGTNAAPTGTYVANCPTPLTGKEKIYHLVNDPCTEGFNTWTVTYTA